MFWYLVSIKCLVFCLSFLGVGGWDSVLVIGEKIGEVLKRVAILKVLDVRL